MEYFLFLNAYQTNHANKTLCHLKNDINVNSFQISSLLPLKATRTIA